MSLASKLLTGMIGIGALTLILRNYKGFKTDTGAVSGLLVNLQMALDGTAPKGA